MPSLLDIAPPEITAEEVDIRGTKLRVQGIGADEWARLYARFPDLRAFIAGERESMPALSRVQSQAAVIAAGVGSPGDPEMERAVMERLSNDDQGRIVDVINRLSMPGHIFGPLLNGAAPADPAPSTEAPATK